MREAAESEFADFFTGSWDRLFRSTYAVAGDYQLAEDALQNAFAKAYAAWWRVRSADHPEAYVRRMAVNEVLGMRRRGWWRSERVGADVEDTPAGWRDRAASPEDGLLLSDEVWAAVRSLPVRQRAVVVLRYYEDLTEQQIAAVLGCRPGTVKSQAAAALKTLRRVLAEDPLAVGNGEAR